MPPQHLLISNFMRLNNFTLSYYSSNYCLPMLKSYLTISTSKLTNGAWLKITMSVSHQLYIMHRTDAPPATSISEINKIKQQLIEGMKNKKLFKIINSIPGFGEFSTALFLAEVGDITRFDDKYQFISFIGIDSVTSQSGVSAYHGPISKTGCKFGRTILFNVVTTLLQISANTDKSNPIYLFFRKKQSEGKHHYKCIIACETKLCKIIYKLCSSDCLYENK